MIQRLKCNKIDCADISKFKNEEQNNLGCVDISNT